MTIPIPDMKDDEAVAEWYRQERYGPFRITWDETPNATKESYRRDAQLIRRLVREVARKAIIEYAGNAGLTMYSGWEDNALDSVCGPAPKAV